jgi:alkylation response protein AidB-like acyl-CoA dehydrogenase
MQPTFTKAEDEWREEVRAFLDAELPPKYERSVEFTEDDDYWEFAVEFTRKVGKKGWIGLTWPKQYGGLERPAVERLIMAEEFGYRDAPFVNQIGWGGVASALFYGGTEEQKQRFLPGIANMETFWVEGYSEPGAGSDLAGLTTRATRDGDSWVINGQKTYTTFGTHGDVIYTAVRTDPSASKHRGISMFCVPLDAPGIALSPLHNIGGGRQNHTFFDNVRVGDEMLIGEVNRGWDLLMNALYNNAGLHAFHSPHLRQLDDLIDYCSATRRGGELMVDDPIVQDRLAELALMMEAERLLGYDALGVQVTGSKPKYAGAMGVVVWKENMSRFAEIYNEIMGPLGELAPGCDLSPLQGMTEQLYRRSFRTHAGGTPQVKRMVLATRGLGLPR